MPFTFKENFSNGYQFGDIFSSLLGNRRPSSDKGLFGNLWDDLTGKSNTNQQNAASAAMQQDAQSFNSQEAAAQRAWESDEMEKNRLWQTEMANTAVQREVADLKAAGLNPALAASGNGASTGSAVMSTGSSASSGIGNTQASAVNMLASVGTAAAGIGILLKAIKGGK